MRTRDEEETEYREKPRDTGTERTQETGRTQEIFRGDQRKGGDHRLRG